MQNTFIWFGEENNFDVIKLKSYLPEISGVKNIKNISESSETMLLDWEFDFNNDSTIVTLHKGCQTISMQGSSEASLQMALEIQQKEDKPLRIYDENYNFHFSMKDTTSLEKLKEKIKEHYFDDEALKMEATN